MRYIRFLKTPRIVAEKGTGKSQIYGLITITSDLGDSFFPHDVELVAELINADSDEILVWRTLAWAAGMRTLAMTLPLKKSYASSPLRVRIGTEHKAQYDIFENLCQADSHGIVSAWSAGFNSGGVREAVKLVQRRFRVAHRVISVWEETGESIARHLWDAGITLSCQMVELQSIETALCKALNLTSRDPTTSTLGVLELGTGCGMVGMTLASVLPNCDVHLSDLPEAREIVETNIADCALQASNGSNLSFFQLDWDDELPDWLTREHAKFDLVLAADCTYNSDSSPALVSTLRRLADLNKDVVVGIAMKMRHDSERVFFGLMKEAGFAETALFEYPLPGDVDMGEDSVYLHVYRHGS
ncbi:uncharacterized protein M421DRAFT_4052 [Didymella exigua CBS 183.55]|uniref:S-adenosyl-L-methionine-dependent methyltransferase n=1 Tax=Didymella exigua CBS 183.55 TaxID=1150837 RepID=A0A6A5RPK8_9PLEO|nr:uncharacterized protein M421DRAFT_4052 [Didymella exigua CBS 183.55]KAF1929589.1 hypothetical protein M421DRAFT_4052 [Didymella exigua CBS 183.55]